MFDISQNSYFIIVFFVFSSARFCAPVILCVPRDIDYRSLQRKILNVMGECIKEGLLAQARMSRRLELLYRLVSSNIVGKKPYKYEKTCSIIVRIHQNDYACNT